MASPSSDASEGGTPGEAGRRSEPEKLLLPAGAVQYLVQLALRTQLGEAWWRGFACAYGEPAWLRERRWTLRAQDASLVRTAPPEAPGGQE